MGIIKDSLEVFKEGAVANFKVYGWLLPVLAYDDGEPKIMGLKFSSQQDKENCANLIVSLISQGKAKEYILVTEAWDAHIEEGQEKEVSEWLQKHGSLENWPNRGEVVIVQYCSAGEEIEYTADIERGITTTLGPWRKTERKVKYDPLTLAGRFQGLFLKGKAGQN